MRSERKLFDEQGQFLGWTPDELAELRERFVRARFGEQKVFAREDIEEWLQHELQNNTPSVGWEHLISEHADKGGFTTKQMPLTEILYRRGLELSSFCGALSSDHQQWLADVWWFVFSVGSRGRAYLMPDGAIFLSPDKSKRLVLEPSMFGHCGTFGTTLLASHVAKSLLMSWQYLGSNRRSLAREYLCGWLARKVAQEREKAERAFNDAVAVSADGKKIVTADEVWVCLQLDRSQARIAVCSRDGLNDTKLFLDSGNCRGVSDVRAELLANALEDSWKAAFLVRTTLRSGSQAFIKLHHAKRGNVLLTRKELVPAPLLSSLQ